MHTLRKFIDAVSFDGPSIIIGYSPCGEHGYDFCHQHVQQELAVKTGHRPLFSYDPRRAEKNDNPFKLD